MISPETYDDLLQMLRFRHASRNLYASELRPTDTFWNYEVAVRAIPAFLVGIEQFSIAFGSSAEADHEPPA